MGNYVLSCCSTTDLSKQRLNERNIEYTCFHYSLNGKNYLDDLGETLSLDDFYSAMANGAETKTAQINAVEYEKYFEKFLKDGKDLVHVTMSSGISGSYNSALIAKRTLEEKYPERKLYVIDSLGASSGYGLIMDKLADLRDEGYSAEELYAWAEEHKLEMHHWFFSTDLSFYVKGGRISKASGWFGTVLKICPLLNMDNEGHLVPRFKLLGKRRVIEATVAKMKEFALDGANYSENCFISNSAAPEDAEAVKNAVEKNFPNLVGKVKIFSIGTTIGSHTGPGTVALFFWGKKREN